MSNVADAPIFANGFMTGNKYYSREQKNRANGGEKREWHGPGASGFTATNLAEPRK